MYRSLNNSTQYDSAVSTVNDDSLLRTINSAAVGAASVPNTKQNLLQLIRQHQNQSGWILLVAPVQLPDKEWAEHYQLSLHNVLVIHQKQITDLSTTLQQALTSPSCKVVINFGSQLDQNELDVCRKLAICNNTWFYQCEQLQREQTTH
jgi:cell division inhibitor SulA